MLAWLSMAIEAYLACEQQVRDSQFAVCAVSWMVRACEESALDHESWVGWRTTNSRTTGASVSWSHTRAQSSCWSISV